MADQIGHLTLGLAPTLLLCWILCLAGIAAHWWEFAVIAGAIFAYWIKKELDDLKETRGRVGDVFPFHSGDIVRNVKTALLILRSAVSSVSQPSFPGVGCWLVSSWRCGRL